MQQLLNINDFGFQPQQFEGKSFRRRGVLMLEHQGKIWFKTLQ